MERFHTGKWKHVGKEERATKAQYHMVSWQCTWALLTVFFSNPTIEVPACLWAMATTNCFKLTPCDWRHFLCIYYLYLGFGPFLLLLFFSFGVFLGGLRFIFLNHSLFSLLLILSRSQGPLVGRKGHKHRQGSYYLLKEKKRKARTKTKVWLWICDAPKNC